MISTLSRENCWLYFNPNFWKAFYCRPIPGSPSGAKTKYAGDRERNTTVKCPGTRKILPYRPAVRVFLHCGATQLTTAGSKLRWSIREGPTIEGLRKLLGLKPSPECSRANLGYTIHHLPLLGLGLVAIDVTYVYWYRTTMRNVSMLSWRRQTQGLPTHTLLIGLPLRRWPRLRSRLRP